MQAKLLRALQEKSFFRLGSERVTRSDFRIIAATNRDLYADMNAGSFREDLFYRLAVIRIDLPPLRERPDDIRWLTERLLAAMVVEQGRPLAMSELFLRDVMARGWRGNVRELRSYLEQAVIMSDGGILDEPLPGNAERHHATIADTHPIVSLQAMVEETESKHIQRALRRCEGSVSKTADLLGISRKTLWEKMKRLTITA
jgi:DNA-binding NtrC family response regulator